MIASDYLRCARSDVEAKERYLEIDDNLQCLISPLLAEFVGQARVRQVVTAMLAHMQVSCYYPKEEK